MSLYILMPAAQEDLADIRDYCLEEAGNWVAKQMLVEFVEAFRFLARTPGAGHVRKDLAEDRPILFEPMRDYLFSISQRLTLWRSFRSFSVAAMCPV
jgi:antitoxin ParD1/3/4/toxin ParE1/3/4